MDRLAETYREFAHGSPLYAELGAHFAQDDELLGWLRGLPVAKRQPNLVFAAYRLVAGTPSGWEEFEPTLKDRRAEVEAVMGDRRTQTNEAARCSLMLPLLASLPQPLALLEVGASAGLCLLPDRYAYDYDDGRHTLGAGPPTLRCRTDGDPPLPSRLPEIAWRAGLDLDPVDVFDEDRIRWLELLIWPGQEHRVQTLHAAVRRAREDPPRIVAGDLTSSDLDALAAEAPRDATLVIFHTAVLFYVARPGRDVFRRKVRELGATWLACEGPDVLGVENDRRRQARRGSEGFPVGTHVMALTRDGRRVAYADGHGAYLGWG